MARGQESKREEGVRECLFLHLGKASARVCFCILGTGLAQKAFV